MPQNYCHIFMKRRRFTSKFKTKVVLEALKGKSPLADIAQRHSLHPQQIKTWKLLFIERAESLFEKGKGQVKSEEEKERERLLQTIGELKVENDFLKKALK